MKKKSEKRTRKEQIAVRVTPEEKDQIARNADSCGKSSGGFLRELGLVPRPDLIEPI